MTAPEIPVGVVDAINNYYNDDFRYIDNIDKKFDFIKPEVELVTAKKVDITEEKK